jgi:hypothetical protein
MNTHTVEKTLTALGLWKAIKGVPALLISVVVFIALIEAVVLHVFGLSKMFAAALQLLTIMIGTLFGLVSYVGGNFWDSKVFDPRYSLRGRWLQRTTRPFHVFPAGSDLKRSRDRAVQAICPEEEGVYKKAERLANPTTKTKAQARQWEYIEQPLILSKFIRSFIWPFAVMGTLLFVLGFGELLLARVADSMLAFGLSALIFLVTILLFIPYFHFRVEHIIRLFDFVAEKK